MAAFIRIKEHIINLESVTHIRVGENSIEFGFACPTEQHQTSVRLEKGRDLSPEEFEETREFVFGLAEPDRVIVV